MSLICKTILSFIVIKIVYLGQFWSSNVSLEALYSYILAFFIVIINKLYLSCKTDTTYLLLFKITTFLLPSCFCV